MSRPNIIRNCIEKKYLVFIRYSTTMVAYFKSGDRLLSSSWSTFGKTEKDLQKIRDEYFKKVRIEHNIYSRRVF